LFSSSALVSRGSGTRRIFESRLNIAYRPSSGRSAVQIRTAVPGTLETIVLPARSTIEPRCASTRIVRSWLFCAAFR
jgi:hypothetical protein